MDDIEPGFHTFLTTGEESFGAVRAVYDTDLVVYVENAGDFIVPLEAVDEVTESKVILTTDKLAPELLDAIAPLERGAEATPEDKERVEQIVQQLEAVNQVKEPLKSDLLNGKWELLYTTSTSILQPQRPKYLRPFGKIYQAINADTLRAQNMETYPYFNQVTANLVPLNARRVAVKFDYFKIFSLIPIKAPGSGKGELEITYLDEELRVSRGDKGNLFVLKMVDPTYRVPL